MHLITRSIQQSVVIDDDIHVTILEIKEDRVILEVHSPSSKVPYQIETLYIQSKTDSELEHDSVNEQEAATELIAASV
ncbi:MAG: carbon storage regulator [Planctomycetaceae bacterium]|nr:carbon storage regulator [Planctomycetaceae bacterium]